MLGLIWATIWGVALAVGAFHLTRAGWDRWLAWSRGSLSPATLRRLRNQARRSPRLRKVLEDRNAILEQLPPADRRRWTRAVDRALLGFFDLDARMRRARQALAGADVDRIARALEQCGAHPGESESRLQAYRDHVARIEALVRSWEWRLQTLTMELRSIRLASVARGVEPWPPSALLDLEGLTLELGAEADLELLTAEGLQPPEPGAREARILPASER